MLRVIKLMNTDRVLESKIGMTFIVEKFSESGNPNRPVAHIRDYRFPTTHKPFQIWSLPYEHYTEIK